MCDYSLQGFFAQAYGVCVAYVATLKKTPKLGLSLHAFHHDNCVGLNMCMTTACKDLFAQAYGVCVAYVATLKKTPKMGLSLHVFSP